jgi:plastocyanin
VDAKGGFEIEFTADRFKNFFTDDHPDVYVKIFRGEELIYTTEEHVAHFAHRSHRHRLDVTMAPLELEKLLYPRECRERHIYLKIERILGYSPVEPDADAHGLYRPDCFRGPGHEDATIPDAEVGQRKLDAVVFREYLDAAYTLPKTTKLVIADLTEPAWYTRVPGTVIYTRPGQRLVIHVFNADERPHSLHVHGLAYGVDSDGAWPYGVASLDGRRSDQICPGETWTYTYDVRRDMIGCWPFHSHHRHPEEETNLGLFGGIVVRDPGRRCADYEIPFFLHRMQGDRTGAAFDSGTLGSGATFSYTFPVAGTFAYACRFHPMSGTVVVDPTGPATATVSILDGPSRFDPATVTVAPGGTVSWTSLGVKPTSCGSAIGAIRHLTKWDDDGPCRDRRVDWRRTECWRRTRDGPAASIGRQTALTDRRARRLDDAVDAGAGWRGRGRPVIGLAPESAFGFHDGDLVCEEMSYSVST